MNPNFKETNEIILENFKLLTNVFVYKLKKVSNACYFACLNCRENIQIYKYLKS